MLIMGGEIYNKIILASASPRRSELLARAGIPFEVRVSDAAEDNSQGIEPSELVHRNALAKALSVAARFPERTVLGADTIVSLGGKIYGKPADLRDAERMLRELSGKTHSVFTGVAFAKEGGKKSAAFAEESRVTFKTLSGSEISEYLKCVDALDKAGKARMQPFSVLLLECPYPMFERVKLLIEDHEGRIESSDYGAAVTLTFLLPVQKVADFSAALTELSGGQMSAEEVEQRFLPGARE